MKPFGWHVAVVLLLCLDSRVAEGGNVMDKVSLYNRWSGAILVMEDPAPETWLWGEWPYYVSNNNDDWNNWLVQLNDDSSLTFVNPATRTCITSYSDSGLTHDRCREGDSQKFVPVFTSTTAVQLFSPSRKKCLQMRTSPSYTRSFVVDFTTCAASEAIAPASQLWILQSAVEASRLLDDDALSTRRRR